MLTITRRVEFDAGHRVLGHEGKCRDLHGHRYQARVTVTSVDSRYQLDDLGRVVDFSCLKSIIGGWIDEHWDHNMILHPDDPLLAALQDADWYRKEGPLEETQFHTQRVFPRAPFIMPGAMNPTAENLARVIFYDVCCKLLPSTLRVLRVRMYETPNCYADCVSSRADGDDCSPR